MRSWQRILQRFRPLLWVGVSILATQVLAQERPGQPSGRPTGPYLGQDPTGTTPRVFSPGFVSTEAHEFSFSMNPEGTELYFSRGTGQFNRKQIMVTRLENGSWTEPAPLFPDLPGENFEPSVTPDGKHLYFMAFHEVEGQQMPDIDLYRADRGATVWGPPYRLEEPFNPANSMYASVTNDGILYTTDPKSGGLDIARTRPTDAGFGPYENVGRPINTEGREMYPFIAPDESFLLYCRVAEGRRPIMASFRLKDGSWSPPQEIPLGMDAGTPFVSRDGKYLFFSGGRMPSDIYWVSFDIVRALQPERAQ